MFLGMYKTKQKRLIYVENVFDCEITEYRKLKWNLKMQIVHQI